jgi:hypothetical protein
LDAGVETCGLLIFYILMLPKVPPQLGLVFFGGFGRNQRVLLSHLNAYLDFQECVFSFGRFVLGLTNLGDSTQTSKEP